MGVRMGDFHPSHTAKGKPNPAEFGTFGEFMVSGQIRRPLRIAAGDIAGIAALRVPPSADARGGHYRDHFRVIARPGMTMVVGTRYRNRRAFARIENDAKNAVPLEFGSGEQSEGDTSGVERPQGGWNRPKRPLGTAGRIVGRPFDGGD